MWCLRTAVGMVVVAVMFSAAPAMADYDIAPLGRMSLPVYLKSENPVATEHLVWPMGERKHFREEPAGSAAAVAAPGPCVDCIEIRMTSWRIEVGTVDGIDWGAVMVQLKNDFGVEIGKKSCCHIIGWVKPVEGYTCTVGLYARYTMEMYRIQVGWDVWVISVLTPTDGIAKVYDEVQFNGLSGVAPALNPSFPMSAMGTCASPGGVPFEGNDCGVLAGQNGKGPQIEIRPSDTVQRGATWGEIKALYNE